MRDPPQGWPRISCSVYYEDPARAIDWVVDAFGFEVRLKVVGDGGRIEHSELTLGGGLIMIGDAAKAAARSRVPLPTPKALGGANTQQMCIYVDDVDAHCARARAAGAKITHEPATTDYGDDYWTDRYYEAEDPEGHRWYFMQRLRSPH
ncbi:MAG TPA: VOC family protein [Steroidobacteraceae bacterium]|nr:VOC family protein [Steroidobacteraceae bacterium]